MKLLAAVLAVLAVWAAALLSSCVGSAEWDIPPPKNGQWPFDRHGTYHEEFSNGRHPDADLYYAGVKYLFMEQTESLDNASHTVFKVLD